MSQRVPKGRQGMQNTARPPHGSLPKREPVEVLVRCDWRDDGVVWQEGVVYAWDREYVYGQLTGPDAEVVGTYFHLLARDVRRRQPVDNSNREPA